MRIQPSIKTSENGPYGVIFEDEAHSGFSAREYGSIPPVTNPDFLTDLDGSLEEALERIIVDPGDMKWLEEKILNSILILKYGYINQLNRKENCTDEALSHRSPRVQYLWARLNWDELIELNFEPKDAEWIIETKEFYASINKEPPVETLYHTPSAQWSYLTVDYDGYAGSSWYVCAHFRRS